MRMRVLLGGLAAALSTGLSAQADTPDLQAKIAEAVKSSETMARNSTQPSHYIIFEISKAVREVAWTSGAPTKVLEAEIAKAKTAPGLSPEATMGLTIIEKEMAE